MPDNTTPSADQPSTEPAIRIGGLQHSFGEGELRKQVLFDNELEVARGEIVIMTGPSGSGKTTLLTLIGTLRTVQAGSLNVLGCELRGASARRLIDLRRQIGFIFQAHNLFESLSAYQNVKMAMELVGVAPSEMKPRATEMLSRVGLEHRIHYKPAELSGGQKQRVAISRGLIHRPRLILADEPTAALDEKSGRDVVTLFQELATREQVTVLMVTHDNRILDVADRIVNMVDGRIKSNVLVKESAKICEFIKGCSVFTQLTPRTLTQVADQMVPEKVAAGSVIIRQGEPGDKFYLIRHGEVDVIVEKDGTDQTVASLGEGDFFGEAALLTGEPRNATIRAKTDASLYWLGNEVFQTVMRTSASFEEELRKSLFERQ
ncbi:MAG: ATP-binding cassette domain-containing protein [Planctomycetes bacterium]|nr:ATP-binding cassette domain-containing protein [Planctomycetota bacterium]